MPKLPSKTALKAALKTKLQQEQQQSQAKAATAFDPVSICHAKQAAFVRDVLDPSVRNVVAKAGRQSGKSFSAVAAGSALCILTPGISVVYIAATRDSVKRMAWKAALAINRDYNLGAIPNYTDLTLTFPNGSQLILLGVDTEKAAGRIRGIQHLIACFIDEMQLFTPIVADELIKQTVRPALAPLSGKLVLMGTAKPNVFDSPFLRAMKNKNFAHHKWTVYDRVGLTIAGVLQTLERIEATIQEDLEVENETKDSAWFQTEYMAEDAVDEAKRAYAWDSDRNLLGSRPLPRLSHFIVAADIGVNDEDAFVVLGWTDNSPRLYLVEEFVKAGLTTPEEEIIFERLYNTYHPILMVVDTGGQGLKTFVTVQTAMPHLPLIAATKPLINIQVKFLNDALKAGFTVLDPASRFVIDIGKATWKNGLVNGLLEESGAKKSNIVPACRYGVIAVKPYLPAIAADDTVAEQVDPTLEYLLKQRSKRQRDPWLARAENLYR